MMRRMDAAPVATCAIAVALAVAAIGCGRAPAESGAGGTITLALRDSFATFDPAFAWDPEQTPYLRLVYEGLVAFDDSGRVVPACAERWQVSDGGRTVRFELRPGLRDARGVAIGAEDFARGLVRLFRTGALRSPGAPQFVALAGALQQGIRRAPPLGVEAPDARTLVLRLAWPDPFLLEKLAQPRYALPLRDSASVETNGPYRLERAAGAYVFVRDPAWGAGLAATDARRLRAGTLDTIRVLTGLPARRALLGLESGRIDLLCPPPLEFRDRLLRTDRFGHVEAQADPPRIWHLALNAEVAPTARRDARRGIALALNRARLPEGLGSWVMPWRAFTSDATPGAAEAPGYDPDRARLSLEVARYFTGIRLPVSVPRASATAAGLEALAPALARGAVQLETVLLPRDRWSREAVTRRGAAATILPWQAPARDGIDELAALYLNRGMESGWGGSWARYRPGPELDSLLLRGLREADPVARGALRDRVGTLLAGDLPLVPLARVGETVVYRRELSGVRFHPREGLDLGSIRRLSPAPSLTGNR